MNVELLVTDKIFYLFIIMLEGFVVAKLKVITEEVNKGISKIVLNVTFPLLIFTTFATKDISFQILVNCAYILLFSYVSLFVLFSTGFLSSKLLKLKPFSSSVHILHTIHGNIAFLGFPIIASIYGSIGLLYASFFILANDSVLWTLGVYLLNKNSDLKKHSNVFLHLVNPNIIALLLGIVIMLLQLKLPSKVLLPFEDVGHVTIVLSMIYIGATLSYIKLERIVKNIHVIVLTFNKLLLIPILLLFVFKAIMLLFHLNIENIALSIVIIEVSMPAMTTIAILAKEYNSDYIQATENILITTIASIFSIPFVIYLIHKFF